MDVGSFSRWLGWDYIVSLVGSRDTISIHPLLLFVELTWEVLRYQLSYSDSVSLPLLLVALPSHLLPSISLSRALLQIQYRDQSQKSERLKVLNYEM